jgi:UTP:GlnB (protein PII) uridylyltransferase
VVEEITMAAGACWPDASGELTVLAGRIAVDDAVHDPGTRIDLRTATVTATEPAVILRITGSATAQQPAECARAVNAI